MTQDNNSQQPQTPEGDKKPTLAEKYANEWRPSGEEKRFSQQDLIDCWDAAWTNSKTGYIGYVDSPPDKKQYFKDKFGIDI